MLEMSLDPYRGGTKGTVFNDFLSKQEFLDLCSRYGIDAGTGDRSAENEKYTGTCGICGPTIEMAENFIKHLYLGFLERYPSAEEVNAGITKVMAGNTGAEIAKEIMFGDEFIGRNLCDEHLLERLFIAFFAREATETEKSQLMESLQNGISKGDLFNGFVNVYNYPEFWNMCQGYNIDGGSRQVTGPDFTSNGNCDVCSANE